MGESSRCRYYVLCIYWVFWSGDIAYVYKCINDMADTCISIGYAFIYTMFLKRATPQNIVIGGLAGATPPLLGWTAVTGEIHHNALLLVLIILPGHLRIFGIGCHGKDEYAKVSIPMLPVTHRRYIVQYFLYTLLLLVVTTLPYLTGMFGVLYLVGELLLGLYFYTRR